jgi:hypothetical protein
VSRGIRRKIGGRPVAACFGGATYSIGLLNGWFFCQEDIFFHSFHGLENLEFFDDALHCRAFEIMILGRAAFGRSPRGKGTSE